MDALHEAAAATAQWLAYLNWALIPLATLGIAYAAVRRVSARRVRGTAAVAGEQAGGPPGPGSPRPAAEAARLEDLQAHADRLERDNRFLEQALALRSRDVDVLTARMTQSTARDREELVRLQDELEGDHRLGREKARLIRSLESALTRAQLALRETASERERQRVAVSALQAALSHSKRAQASTEERLANLREQLRQQALPVGQEPASQRIVERIIEIPVETIVYRDREVPVEVPIEVPVGFTVLDPPPAAGLRPRYSENRPASR